MDSAEAPAKARKDISWITFVLLFLPLLSFSYFIASQKIAGDTAKMSGYAMGQILFAAAFAWLLGRLAKVRFRLTLVMCLAALEVLTLLSSSPSAREGELVAPSTSMAEGYSNGWTEHSFKVAVTGCVAAAYDKQMRFMYTSGQITENASGEQIDAASARVTAFVTSTCTCAQRRFMQDIRFDDIQSVYQRRDYAAQVMDACAKEVLKKRS